MTKLRTVIALVTLAMTAAPSFAQLATFIPEFEPQQIRLKDIADIQTLQDVQLLGYGLVVGLEGEGDGRGAPFTIQALANLMRNMGVEVDPSQIRAKNTAAVMITARLTPFARIGGKIDVTVSSVGDASSLEGGVLLMTPLQANPPSGPTMAMAQGAVSIGGFNAEGGGGGSVTKNHPLVGRIPNGAIVQQELVPGGGDIVSTLTVMLRDPDYTTAARLGRAIDVRFGHRMASALDGGQIRVRVPRSRQKLGSFIEFTAELEAVTVIPDTRARVVVNERTGTIVVGENVAIAEVAISHGNLSITVGPTASVEGEAGGANVTATLLGLVQLDEEKPRVLALPPASSVSDVAKALNALKVTPRDIIAIFQSLKQAGALKAELTIL